ncbi:hypothetical protein CFIICLFH_4265 [Methylobacterium goesingense]|nr:hypothetical protein CFIICLFH_4265 [Methylobacterium goesingense]
MQIPNVRRRGFDLITGQDDCDNIAIVHDRPHWTGRVVENGVAWDKTPFFSGPAAHHTSGS